MKTKSSWKTSLGGALVAFAPIAHVALPPAWQWVAAACLSIGGLIMGVSARDNNVSSEQAGIK